MNTSVDPSATRANQQVGGADQVVAKADGRVEYNGVNMSVLEAVSLLFIERAQTYSTLTADQLKDAKDNLGTIKQARKYMQQVRTIHQGLKNDGDIKKIPPGLKDFCQSHGIKLPDDDDNQYSKGEFQTVLDNLQGGLDNFQDSNQLKMLKLKSEVGHFDTSITGASKNVEKTLSTTKDIISGLGR